MKIKISNSPIFWHKFDPEELRDNFALYIDEFIGQDIWVKVRSVRNYNIEYYFRFDRRVGDRVITNYITGDEIHESTCDRKRIKYMLMRTFEVDLSNITDWYMIDIPLDICTTEDLIDTLLHE